jgi:hypothetical protein
MLGVVEVHHAETSYIYETSYMYVYVYVCLYVCLYVCIYIYVFIYIYVYIYIYIHYICRSGAHTVSDGMTVSHAIGTVGRMG